MDGVSLNMNVCNMFTDYNRKSIYTFKENMENILKLDWKSPYEFVVHI